jgi:abhydrolase domain-containing protein 12
LGFKKIKSTILIVHAANDPTIPKSHAVALFDELLEPSLPSLPFAVEDLAGRTDEETWKQMNAATEARRQTRAKLVSRHIVPDFAHISEFKRPASGKVMHVETHSGGHVNILKSEGLLDIMGDLLSISRP